MMKVSSYATAVLAAALFVSSCEGVSSSPWGKTSTKFNNLFGLSANTKFDLEQAINPLLSTRGGATVAAPEDEAETAAEEAELYLPGLLDAVISRPDMVRYSFYVID